MNRAAIVCALLLAAASLSAATKPKIMIQLTVAKELGFENPDGVAESLESHIQYLIRQRFPCAETLTPHDVRNFMSFMRQRALLGVPANQEADFEQGMKEMAGAVGVDYLVILQAQALPSRWVMDGKWLDVRKVTALAMSMEDLAANGDALVDASERVANKLMDEAEYHEICPYTGPVKIKIHSARSKHDRVEYLTSCNGMDQQYVKTTAMDRTEDTDLDLRRTGRIWATGEMHYTAIETQDLEEDDPCHMCRSGRRAPRIYTEHQRTEIKVLGFSQDSSTKDQQLTDVRLRLEFTHDGKYTLQLLGATKLGKKHIKIDRKAEGSCDTQVDNPHEDNTTDFDIPIGQIMGPFEGSPHDKTLTAQDEFKTKNQATDEETTINVEFQLSRD